jgi:FlaG/FlaF family flagellin (archaellin)
VTIGSGSGQTTTSITVTAKIKSAGVNTSITSGLLNLATSDGGKTWTCTTSTDLLGKYVPASCR